jgi:hypothetical protein
MRRQLRQMLGPTRGHAIGELRPVTVAPQVDVLDLHIGVRPPRFGQQEVDAAVLAIALLGPDAP